MSFQWLAGLDPAWAVGLVVLLHLVLLVWAVTRPRSLVFAGAPDGARWRDLRLWVAPLLLVQVALYLLLC